MPKLETTLTEIANLRSADKESVADEIINHNNMPFNNTLLKFQNQVLIYKYFNESIQSAILQMITKDGALLHYHLYFKIDS